MTTSVLQAIPETVQELFRAQLRIASDVIDLIGRPLVTQARRMTPHGCCEIPPPCWVFTKIGDVVSLVKCGGTATLALRVRNCGPETHIVRVTASPVDADAPAGTPMPVVTPGTITLHPYQRATITATVAIPDHARDSTLAFHLFILGCRRYYVTWTIKSGSVLTSSRHELDLDD